MGFPPSFQHGEEAAHHLLVLFLCHRLRHLLVDLVNELCTMFNHFVHRTFLQEFPVLVAILAIIEISAAVSILATVLDTGQRHTATLAELR